MTNDYVARLQLLRVACHAAILLRCAPSLVLFGSSRTLDCIGSARVRHAVHPDCVTVGLTMKIWPLRSNTANEHLRAQNAGFGQLGCSKPMHVRGICSHSRDPSCPAMADLVQDLPSANPSRHCGTPHATRSTSRSAAGCGARPRSPAATRLSYVEWGKLSQVIRGQSCETALRMTIQLFCGARTDTPCMTPHA